MTAEMQIAKQSTAKKLFLSSLVILIFTLKVKSLGFAYFLFKQCNVQKDGRLLIIFSAKRHIL